MKAVLLCLLAACSTPPEPEYWNGDLVELKTGEEVYIRTFIPGTDMIKVRLLMPFKSELLDKLNPIFMDVHKSDIVRKIR